ncbi:MAG TPA: Ohr family peroxiredoxin [Lysobacter sp.]
MTPQQPPPATLLEKYYGDEARTLFTGRVSVISGGDRQHWFSGLVRSDDGALDLNLRLHSALGGPGGGTNPEQLLAASYAACFHGALTLLASRARVALPQLTVDAGVTLARDPVDGLYLLSADIRVSLPGLDRTLAAELVRNTERFCPFSKMFRHGIDHVVTVSTDAKPMAHL